LRGAGLGRTASTVWQSLVEIRLRLGRVDGVDRYLREAEAAARRGCDRAFTVRIAGLRVRQRLVEGRPGAALELARQALGLSEAHETRSPAIVAERRLLELLAARALGWLGRAEESRRGLESCDERIWSRLEGEERALAWLVAASEDRALESAEPGPVGDLIRCFGEGRTPPDATWQALESLAPYRAPGWSST